MAIERLQYNWLNFSLFFYELCREYGYLLAYELNLYVFKNELIFWSGRGCDLIGAPWCERYRKAVEPSGLSTGDSGFSLRNVPYCSLVLKGLERLWHLK